MRACVHEGVYVGIKQVIIHEADIGDQLVGTLSPGREDVVHQHH